MRAFQEEQDISIKPLSARVIAIVMMTLVPMNVVKLTVTLADHKATAHNIGRLCHEDVEKTQPHR